MRKPTSVEMLDKLGRVRLSEHFFMRDMLHSEIAFLFSPSSGGRDASASLAYLA